MRQRLAVPLLFCLVAGAGLYFLLHSSRAPAKQEAPLAEAPVAANPAAPVPSAPTRPTVRSAPAPVGETGETTPSVTAVTPPPPALSIAAAQSVPAPEPDGIAPATVLANMRATVRQYAEMFGGNPVGTNPEITRALNGDNPRHIIFLKPDGNRVNDNGELVDPWGTPYFFHQLSAQDMEIRSAGPDKLMWTSDDLVTR